MMAASSIPGRWKYDVFVSFRGEDIRKSFMDHLFKDFRQKGIQAFRDDKELPKGEEIYPELSKAIEHSRFLIVIFSKNYASSSWCLRELVKILECKKMGTLEHNVCPIFYHVKPDVVRKQTESYAEAFAKHESSNRTHVAKWKEALTMAASLSGWDLQDLANGYEAKFIDSISKKILKNLCDGPLHVGENIVAADAHLKKLNLLRFVGSDKVHMIGICGVSGIGKTTLSKAIYNLMYTYFEGSSFCDDVQVVSKREGLPRVQMQLIDDIMKQRVVNVLNVAQGIMVIKRMMSSKPILLVLDDVDHREQLEALAGSHNWFSPGSLIIFTSKEKQLLKSHRVDEIYDMDYLNEVESLELFNSFSFYEKHPTKGFEKLAQKAMKYVQGHPLALKVLGCFLYGKSVGEWDSELERLKFYPNDEIQKVLRLSYDRLNFLQQRILLDIASSFIGMNKDLAASVLDSCGFHAYTNIRVLVDMSLITISQYDMSLKMHELIQSMTKEIVREESHRPGQRSRLWGPSKEVYDVLSKNEVGEEVEVIALWKGETSQKFNINGSVFERIKNLRILKMPEDPNVNFSGRLAHLSNKLRYLCWHRCPYKFLPAEFYPENIVIMDLSYSNIKNLWTTPKRFTRLKILKLSHCHNLTKTPNFTEITNLEELILEGCVSLVEFHSSIGMLKRLLVLNLSGCLKLNHLPSALGRIKTLLELRIDRTTITRFPAFEFLWIKRLASSFGQHHNLLRWATISQPSWIPRSSVLFLLDGLCSLRTLNLSYCDMLQVPENIGGLSCLEEINLSGNSFSCFPRSFTQLTHLWKLNIYDCKRLEVFPELPPSIKHLHASYCNILQVPESIGGISCLEILDLSGNNFNSLPGSLRRLSRLRKIYLDNCKKLDVLPELPPSITSICACFCGILHVPEEIGDLSDLRLLQLDGNSFTSLPGSLSRLSNLDVLYLNGCNKLEVFPELPPSIEQLEISDCSMLQEIQNIGDLTCLKWLYLNGCKNLKVLPVLSPSIIYVSALNCTSLRELGNLDRTKLCWN